MKNSIINWNSNSWIDYMFSSTTFWIRLDLLVLFVLSSCKLFNSNDIASFDGWSLLSSWFYFPIDSWISCFCIGKMILTRVIKSPSVDNTNFLLFILFLPSYYHLTCTSHLSALIQHYFLFFLLWVNSWELTYQKRKWQLGQTKF